MTLDQKALAAARKAYAKRWMPSDSAEFSSQAAAQVDYIVRSYVEALPALGSVATDVVTVPREPTEAMMIAGGNDYYADHDERPFSERAARAYRAMIKAAPLYAAPASQALREALTDLCDAWEGGNKGGRFLGNVTKATAAARAALQSHPQEQRWQPIKTAPADVELVLGWWELWPRPVWKTKVDFYQSTKGGWISGQAEYWMPLPAPASAPPSPEAK